MPIQMRLELKGNSMHKDQFKNVILDIVKLYGFAQVTYENMQDTGLVDHKSVNKYFSDMDLQIIWLPLSQTITAYSDKKALNDNALAEIDENKPYTDQLLKQRQAEEDAAAKWKPLSVKEFMALPRKG